MEGYHLACMEAARMPLTGRRRTISDVNSPLISLQAYFSRIGNSLRLLSDRQSPRTPRQANLRASQEFAPRDHNHW
jgi:hypothetical protein